MSKRELHFVDYSVASYVDEIKKIIAEGQKQFYFINNNDLAKKIENKISEINQDVSFLPYVENASGLENNNVLIITDPDCSFISSFLHKCIRLEDQRILAPKTELYYKEKPLFVVSIPKSGTHLLHRLIEVFGYKSGGKLHYSPEPGKWYNLQNTNSHTSAKDFFIDSVSRSPFGNRDHPFVSCPVIMMYRNPLDILVSEANYYHKKGATLFSGYLRELSLSDRLHRLINDPWLLGTIRERVGNYIAYLDFPNVIPVSFEELIGSVGGGKDKEQEELIWSLQLKLQIPGEPSVFAKKIYDINSPTFHSGKIGRYQDCFEENHFAQFNALNQDFMRELGYECFKKNKIECIPLRAQEFRLRELKIEQVDFEKMPILIELDYLNFNIVKYKKKYYGIPLLIGEVDIATLKQESLNSLPQSKLLNDLKIKLMLGSDYPRLMRSWTRNSLIPAINKDKNAFEKHPYNIFNKLSWLLRKIFR